MPVVVTKLLSQISTRSRSLMHGRLSPRTALRSVFLCALFMGSSGCGRLLLGDDVYEYNPQETPAVNISTFSESLECLDRLLMLHDVDKITITAQDIPNMTGDTKIISSAKDMLITSISKAGERSGKVRFVAYATDTRDLLLLHNSHKDNKAFVAPDYFIRGAITQLDRNVLSNRIGMGFNGEDWNATHSGGNTTSYAALDLNVGEMRNLEIIPGVSSNNVLAITVEGSGSGIGGRINSVGSFFDFGIDKREGVGQAIRNLIDLGTIEVIGRLTQIPYLTCLPVDYEVPEIQALIKKEYNRYLREPAKLVKATQVRLRELDYYHGPIDGKINENTVLAINYFKELYRFNDANPRITYDLYFSLMYGEPYEWDHRLEEKKKVQIDDQAWRHAPYHALKD